MFRKILNKKEKPRVFLGSLSVVPRTSIKKIDKWAFYKEENIDSELRKILEEIFSLPPVSEAIDPLKTDLVLDIVIPKYQLGFGGIADIGLIEFPLFWRPKVQVKARLYNLQSKKTKHVFSSTTVISGWKFFNGVFSFRNLFGFHPAFTKTDMNYLLYNTCSNILQQIQQKI